MKYLDEEDKEKLHDLGAKILLARELRKEITEFFVTGDQANYNGAQELLDVVNLYIRGESLDYIGEQIFQDDGKPIREILKLMNIEDPQ